MISKLKDKLKSIDTIIYIVATFFWMVLTLSMILLLLIASYINESSTCSIALGIVFAGIVALFFILTEIKEIRNFLWISNLFLVALVFIITFNPQMVWVPPIFIISTYIINIFTAYCLAKKLLVIIKVLKNYLQKELLK